MPLLTFGWRDVVFEHYRVLDEDRIRRQLPDGVELDSPAYVSVVSVRVVDNRIGGVVPMLGSRDFVQINVRTYVRGGGLVFLHNRVSNPIGAWFGRLAYAVPNHVAPTHFMGAGGAIAYHADAPGHAVHHIAGRIAEPDGGSLGRWLLERYVQYGRIGSVTLEGRVRHRPWPRFRFEIESRSHGLIAGLGLAEAVEPVDEVHVSPGVDALMDAPHLLGTRPRTPSEAIPPRHASCNLR